MNNKEKGVMSFCTIPIIKKKVNQSQYEKTSLFDFP